MGTGTVSILSKYGTRGPKYAVPPEDHLVVAVDLGKHKVGVAVGTPSEMYCAATVVHRGPADAVAQQVREFVALHAKDLPLIWVCEWPMKYPTQRKFHKDLDDLHAVGYAIGTWNESYLPGEWKGNVPKSAHRKRIKSALSPEELDIMPAEDAHDAWDAAGIYLFAVGRTKRGGVK